MKFKNYNNVNNDLYILKAKGKRRKVKGESQKAKAYVFRTFHFSLFTFYLKSRYLLNFRDGPEESHQCLVAVDSGIYSQCVGVNKELRDFAPLRENKYKVLMREPNSFVKSWQLSGKFCVFSVYSVLKVKPRRTQRKD